MDTANQQASEQISRQMTYQKIRLIYGVTGIGIIMMLSWIALWDHQYLMLSELVSGIGSSHLQSIASILLLGVICILAQAPIDRLAYQTDREYGQLICSTDTYRKNYFAGILIWLAGLSIAAVIVSLILQISPNNWHIWLSLTAGSGILLHLAIQPPAGQMATSHISDDWLHSVRIHLAARNMKMPKIVWVDHGERTLNGSWHGLTNKKLYLTRTITELMPDEAATLIAREMGHQAHRHRLWSMLLTWLWITAAILTTWMITKSTTDSRLPAEGLITLMALIATQFYFAGLFIWPAIGRWQVTQADMYPLNHGFQKETVLRTMSTLADRNLPDDTLPDAKAYVFHPIPPMSNRRKAIENYQASAIDS